MKDNKVWVFIDQTKGNAVSAVWEVFTAALSLAETYHSGVTALVFGAGGEAVAQEALRYEIGIASCRERVY